MRPLAPLTPLVHHGAHGLRRHVRTVWDSRGGGFYGFVAALTFLYLEVLDLGGDIASLPGDAALSLGFGIDWVVNNMVDAVLNGVWAALWPVEWIERFGVGLQSGALLLVAYLAYRLVRPWVRRLLEDPEEAQAVVEGSVPPSTA